VRHEDAATAVVAGDHSDPISFLEVHRILIVPVVLALGGYMFNLSQKLAVLRQLDGKGKKNVLLFLREARLVHGAIGVTEEELAQQAYSLEGATMPNGRKYEDWLRSLP
jgi:hypothetical protein